MLEVLPEPARIVVATAALTGLRRSEIRGLKWGDLVNRNIYVNRTVWGAKVQEKTKTVASKAPVPVVPVLQKWLEEHRIGQPQDGLMFVGPKKNHSLNLANLARRVIVPTLKKSREAKKSGVEWHGWHSFRRGLATNLYSLGTSDKDIQAILRHANVRTTLDIYVKPPAANSALAMRKLEKVFKKAAEAARKKA
jgi:integrase